MPPPNQSVLQSMINIEPGIETVKSSNSKLYQALHNMNQALNYAVTNALPPPSPLFFERFYVGTLSIGYVGLPFQIKLPLDDNWTYTSIIILQVTATLQAAPTGSDVKTDIQILQNHGKATSRSILKQGMSIDIPVGLLTAPVNTLAVNQFYDGDILRFNILQIDSGAAASGLEIVLQGSYQTVSK